MTQTTTGGRLELWQDARRTPEQYSADAPDTFEWWYFDANLDGRAVVVTILIEPDAAQGRFSYRSTINLMRPGGEPLKGECRTYDDVAISTERPDRGSGCRLPRPQLGPGDDGEPGPPLGVGQGRDRALHGGVRRPCTHRRCTRR